MAGALRHAGARADGRLGRRAVLPAHARGGRRPRRPALRRDAVHADLGRDGEPDFDRGPRSVPDLARRRRRGGDREVDPLDGRTERLAWHGRDRVAVATRPRRAPADALRELGAGVLGHGAGDRWGRDLMPAPETEITGEEIGRRIVRAILDKVAGKLAERDAEVAALRKRVDELETLVLELTERK